MINDERKYAVRSSAHGSGFIPAGNPEVYDKTWKEAMNDVAYWKSLADTVGGDAIVVRNDGKFLRYKMKFEMKLVPMSSKKNVYVVVLEAMHGDGDHSDYLEFSYKENEFQEFKKHVQQVNEYLSKFDNGGQYFNDVMCKDTDTYPWLDCWPRDITCDSYRACLRGMELFYYDENGLKYTLKIVTEEQ